jgi:hypothetical protein
MSVTVFERAAHVTPIGLRLVDVVTGRTESDGLSVTIVPLPRGRATTAVRTSSGAFAAHGLPGLRRFELQEAEV